MRKLILLVCVTLDVNEVVGHGLVGKLMQDGADGVKTSFHYQQLGLGLSLVGGGGTDMKTNTHTHHHLYWYLSNGKAPKLPETISEMDIYSCSTLMN